MRKTVSIALALVLALSIIGIVKASPASAATTPVTTRVDQTTARISYVGIWETRSTSSAFSGSYRRSSSNAASATITFKGTYLAWIATKGASLGRAYVSLDGKAAVRVNLYNSTSLFRQKVWSTGVLTSGTHTVKIWRDPTSASGKYFDIDAFDVAGTVLAKSTTPTPVTPTPVTPTPSGGTVRVTSTLQAAINAAANGQTIYVPAGSWGRGVINGRSNLTIYGAGTASVVGTIEIGGPSKNIVIHDLLIKDSYANDYNPNLAISSLAGGHFYNLTFSGVGYACINAASTAPSGSSNYFTDVITNIEVDHNVCTEHMGNFGFYVGHGSAYWNIHDNKLGPCDWKNEGPPHQFYIQDSHDITLTSNYAYGTTKSNGFAYKVGVGDFGSGHSYNVKFINNVATGNYGGLWVVAARGVLAQGNQFVANTSQAVQIWAAADNVTLDGNTLEAPLWDVRFDTDGRWASNIRLRNNVAKSGIPIGLGGGPASMIVENTGNSWN